MLPTTVRVWNGSVTSGGDAAGCAAIAAMRGEKRFCHHDWGTHWTWCPICVRNATNEDEIR